MNGAEGCAHLCRWAKPAAGHLTLKRAARQCEKADTGLFHLVSFFLSLTCRIGAPASGRTFSQDFCPSVLSFLHMHRHAAISVRWQQNSVSANRSSHVVLRIAKLFLHGKLLKIYQDVSRTAKIIMNQDLSRSSQYVLA